MDRPERQQDVGDYDVTVGALSMRPEGPKFNNNDVDEERQPHNVDYDEDMPMLGEGDYAVCSPRPTPQDQAIRVPVVPEENDLGPSFVQDNASDPNANSCESGSDTSPNSPRTGDPHQDSNDEYGDNAKEFESESGMYNRRITSNDEPKPNLIVNYLPQNLMDRDFFHLFAPFGAMESIKIMRDTQTGYSFGYGFVNYIDLQDAIEARNEMNGLQVGHKRIKVSFARPPSDDIKDTNLFVTGLPLTITEEELDTMFSPFGVIVHLRVLRDRQTRARRGVAFVRYETRSEACAAIIQMNCSFPPGATESIHVRLAQDHGKQKAAYLAGYQAALKMKGGVQVRVQESPYRHSENAYSLRTRSMLVPNRGRPLTASVGDRDGNRATNSTSDPILYWKGFMQGAREPRRAETSGGRNADRRANSRSNNSRY